MKKYLAFILALVLCFGLVACGGTTTAEPTPTEPEETKVEDDGIMKILLIGHSLGNDSSFMFPDIYRNEGNENLVMGVLYHSGCRVGQHVDYARQDAAQYAYYEYDIATQNEWLRADCNGYFTPYAPGAGNDVYIEDGSIAQTLKFGIQRHDWDLVILQGGLFESAQIKDAYFAGRNLDLKADTKELMDYVLANDCEPISVPQFAWNMTWAYPVEDDGIGEVTALTYDEMVYLLEQTTNDWVTMTDADTDGIYECTMPEGYPNVIFVRMDPAKTEHNWDSKWNQTEDLVIPADKNCFTITSWDGGVDSKSTGTWSVK